MNYRRPKIQGGKFFFTIVTYKRMKILCFPQNISLLRTAFKTIRINHPYTIDAIVVLPDHIHCILTLPQGDNGYPLRIRLIKSYFSRRCGNIPWPDSPSRLLKKERSIWQRRYWEHFIRNENDYKSHMDYIHYNPVKHGYVSSPTDWEYSSFHLYVKKSWYEREWGAGNEILFDDGIGGE